MSAGRPDDDVRELDDQQAVVDLVGRLAEALPDFSWTIGPDSDGRTAVLVAEDDLDDARAFFAERPLKIDGERALEAAVRPGD